MDTQNNASAYPPNPVTISKWVSEGWQLVSSDMLFFFLLGLIYSGILALLARASYGLGYLLLDGPLRVGLFYIIFLKLRGQPADIGQIGKGFEYFIPAVLANLVITLFVGLGFFFCIIPGLVLAAFYQFTLPFILEKKADFWQAMEASRKLVSDHLFEFVLFVLIQGLILLAGALVCLIGLCIAIPVCLAATAAAHRDLVGLSEIETA